MRLECVRFAFKRVGQGPWTVQVKILERGQLALDLIEESERDGDELSDVSLSLGSKSAATAVPGSNSDENEKPSGRTNQDLV